MIPATRVDPATSAQRTGLWAWLLNGWRAFLARREEVLSRAGIPDDSLRSVSSELSSVSSPEPSDRNGGDLLLFALAKEAREEQIAEEEKTRAATAETAKS